MTRLARLVILHRWWVVALWVVLAAAGVFAAPKATAALSYNFGLPGHPGYETNQQIIAGFGSGGHNAPLLLIVGGGRSAVSGSDANHVVAAVRRAAPGARVASFADQPGLLSRDGRAGVVMVYPRVVPGPDAYVAALPALRKAAQELSQAGLAVVVTGEDALAAEGGSGGGTGTLIEVLFGAVGALIVLLLVFGSALAVLPLLIAVGSILTTFVIVWGLTELTDVSFIVQYLLSLIGLGVAIDYALLVVTRWREERGRGADDREAVTRAMATAGRSVLFSGITVAVSLAALIALPVPFLRSVGFTGLLIPIVSAAAALTLLPALLVIAGRRLDWPHRRSTDPDSRLWRRVGTVVVRHRWWAAAGSTGILLALAAPVLGLHLGQPTNASLASTGGTAAAAVTRLDVPGLSAGLTQPVEILTNDDPARVVAALQTVPSMAAAIAPSDWTADGHRIVEAWPDSDSAGPAGTATTAALRAAAEHAGAGVGGIPAQDADFIRAVYGNAGWIVAIIVVVTFGLLAVALRSVVLPLKALALNVISIGAA